MTRIDNDLGFVVLCAMRYAIGRRTYACSIVANFIKARWRDLDVTHRSLLLRDLNEEIERKKRGVGCLGSECDEKVWRELYSWMEQHANDPQKRT
jgi:hypothetical protein